nr:chemotaxis-specific protein-glutamate methyltransferase CheB [bacterium]
MPIKVLVVDDSVLMRAKITELIEKDGDIKVVGSASNGVDAMEKIPRLAPDVVTLDVQMPRLDGISTLKRIMAECPSRVIMLTGHVTYGGEETVRALEMGAIDFVLKPSGSLSLDIDSVAGELRAKIRAAMQADVKSIALAAPAPAPAPAPAGGALRVVVIGASTGGPRSLSFLLPQIPDSLPASIVVVQHMPAFFTTSFAGHLDAALAWSVSEGKDGDYLERGKLVVAPGGNHLDLVREGERCMLKAVPAGEVKGPYTPSISFTMKRAAEIYGGRCVGILLTGMGDDGVEGLKAIRAAGGRTIDGEFSLWWQDKKGNVLVS